MNTINLPRLTTLKDMPSKSSESVHKGRVSAAQTTIIPQISRIASEFDVGVTNSVVLPPGEMKLKTTYPFPDFEDELQKKKLAIEQDKQKELLVFPSNDIKYTKTKKDEYLEWYSMYDVKTIKEINSVGRRNVEVLSSSIENYLISYGSEEYSSYFCTLPSFKPLEQPLFKHTYSKEVTVLEENENMNLIFESKKEDGVTGSGYLEMFPYLMDNTNTSEKWMSITKPKKRFVKLLQSGEKKYYRLEYSDDEDMSKMCKGVIFLEYCSCFRQPTSNKQFCFEIHINEKIIIFKALTENDYKMWTDVISRATGVVYEVDKSTKSGALSYKRTPNVIESWLSSAIPSLVEFSRETDVLNAKVRSENRFKVANLYSCLLEINEPNLIDPDPIFNPGDRQGKRIFFEFSNMSIQINYIEPFILYFSLYDIKEGIKLTEDFVCESVDKVMADSLMKFNQGFSQYHEVVKTATNVLAQKYINSCFFSVPSPHDDIYIVVRVNKLYTSSLNTLWEYYQKTGSRYEAKLGKLFLESNENTKKYSMPVGFSFKRLFYRNELDEETRFQGLIKYDYRLNTAEIIKFIQDYKNDPKLKSISLNMSINYSIKIENEMEQYSTLTSAYEPYKPFKADEKVLYRELQDLVTSGRKFKGFSIPTNLLFISLLNINLSTLKTTAKVKNFLVTMEIYNETKTASSTPLPIIFAHSCRPGFVKTASSSVITGTHNANLLDEYKILLPTSPHNEFNILFTVHSVSCKEKEDLKKKKSSDEIIGYSWVRVFDTVGVLETRECNLPICSTLPTNYISIDLEKLEKSKLPSDLKWLDGTGKQMLKFQLTYVTNYHTSNSYLSRILNYVDDKGIIPETSNEICKFIKWLYSLESKVMITHLYTMMNFLLDLLLKSSSMLVKSKEKGEDLQKNTLRLILLICGEVCRKGRDDMLRGYVKYRFNGLASVEDSYYHDVILNYIATSMGYGSDPVMTENFYLSYWWFFEVIYKSILANVLNQSRLNTNRKGFLKHSTMERLEELIGTVIYLIKSKASDDTVGVKNLNRVLSKFITKCFSIMDRGFIMKLFSIIIENYQENDQIFVSLKYDALAQLCNYEYFVQLNLPLDSPANKTCVTNLVDLSVKYSQFHYPLWLVLSQVKNILQKTYDYRRYGIKLMRNLLIKHNFDDRYNTEEKRGRIHMLYLPLIGIILDMNESLIENANDLSEASKSVDSGGHHGSSTEPRAETLTRRSGMVTITKFNKMNSTMKEDSQVHHVSEGNQMAFSKKEIKEILIIFFQIVKSIEINFLLEWLRAAKVSSPEDKLKQLKSGPSTATQSSISRFEYVTKFLRVLRLSIKIFHLHPISKKTVIRRSDTSTYSPLNVLGQRSDLAIKLYTSYINLNRDEMDSNLFAEVCLTCLDILDRAYSLFKVFMDSDSGNNEMMKAFIDLHVEILQTNCPLVVRKNHFALLRQFINKGSNIMFKGSSNYCYVLCLEFLRLTGNSVEAIRNEAILMIYLVLRSDFVYTGLLYHCSYVNIIIGFSAVVDMNISLKYLFDSMEQLENLVKIDEVMKNSDFSNEVRDLTRRVKNILRLTVRFKELESDPEALVDAHCSIANSFSGAPELRQTWLDRVANLHTSYGNHSEAAMCYIHSAAIVAQTLKRRNVLTDGPVVFKNITPNINPIECSFRDDALSDENRHSIDEFLSLLNQVSEALFKAERYELIADVNKISLPFMEKSEDYRGLSKVYGLLKQSYDKIVEVGEKRYFGTYYRVSFFGKSFKEDHGSQFIYREPKVTSLPEIVERLRNIYESRCPNLKIIMESNKVKWSELDQNNNYLQINAVKPYYQNKIVQKSGFYLHHNIGTFRLETPFTKTGKAHGTIVDQYKRVTTFSTSQCFPYIKKRINIIKSDVYEMTPIEVAIDEMESQVKDLKGLVSQEPPDMKRLQLKLQGSVSVQVNAGPLAYAQTFLKAEVVGNYPKKYTDALDETFKQFLEVCGQALELNGRLIKEDQVEYQKGLMNQYMLLSRDLSAILKSEQKTDPVKPVFSL